MARLGRCPEPSKRLQEISLPLREIKSLWFRSHVRARDPLYFGRNQAFRFDAPDGSFGILYLAADPHVAFIESFQILGVEPVITESALNERWLSQITASRPLRLIDLATSGGLVRIGCDARIFSCAYSVSQRWSLALHSHPDQADGILYRPRHDPARTAAAIFDRSQQVFAVEDTKSWLSQRDLLGNILDTYRVGLMS